MKPLDKLAMSQAERRFEKLRSIVDVTKIKPGWISYMRQVMCMTLTNLAEAVSLTPATVQQMEKREEEGKVTVETLEKLARAMECEFVYAFVPCKEIKETLHEKAISKASRIVKRADTHMELEDQKVEEDFNIRVQRLAEDLIKKGDIW